MTLSRRKRTILALLILCTMLPCAFFSLRNGPHHAAFELALFLLMLLSSWLQYNSNRRQPDTLTRLFTEPAESSKEKIDS